MAVTGHVTESSVAPVSNFMATGNFDQRRNEALDASANVQEPFKLSEGDSKSEYSRSSQDLIAKSLDWSVEGDVLVVSGQNSVLPDDHGSRTSTVEAASMEIMLTEEQSGEDTKITLDSSDVPADTTQIEMGTEKDLGQEVAESLFFKEQHHQTALDLERTKAELVLLTKRFETVSKAEAQRASDAIVREDSLSELRSAYEKSTVENYRLTADLEMLREQLLHIPAIPLAPVDTQREQAFEMRDIQREAALQILQINYENLIDEQGKLQLEVDLHKIASTEARAELALQIQALSVLRNLYQRASYDLSQSRALAETLSLERLQLLSQEPKASIHTNSQSTDSIPEEDRSIMEAQLLECLNNINSSTDQFEIIRSKLIISENIVLLEKLSAENCELRISLLTKETNTRIRSIEKESKNHMKKLASMHPSRAINSTSNGIFGNYSDGFNSLSNLLMTVQTLCSKYKASLFVFLEHTFAEMKPHADGLISSIVQFNLTLPSVSDIKASILIYSSTATDVINYLRSELGPFYSSSVIRAYIFYDRILKGLHSFVLSATNCYKEILFPAFHDVLLPQVKIVKILFLEFAITCYNLMKEQYIIRIHPSAIAILSPVYSKYLQPHFTFLVEKGTEFYEKYLYEHVVMYINPTCTFLWASICSVAYSTQTALVEIDGENIMRICFTYPSDLLSSFLINRAVILMYLQSHPIVERRFGSYSGKVVTIFANFVIAYMLYFLVGVIIRLVFSIAILKKGKNMKIQSWQPNIPNGPKGLRGSDDLTVRVTSRSTPSNIDIDCKDERGPKIHSVLRRSRSPEKAGGHPSNSPYAGLPLAKQQR